MALDSKQKRASAVQPGLPFRVPGVDPEETGFGKDERFGAVGLYSGQLSEDFLATGVFADTFWVAGVVVANREITRNVTAFS